ncbi:hypothetical protein JKP88DRAFT_282763 [Tribonema minus]|uniref:Uncharacterized protein n=1 Tax=Tribonema minus TaxID=303371 RepID=A0A835YJP5_9STRA|nr:hypothetical protein JKP88DRAFT_282763 [Tribonema minus]
MREVTTPAGRAGHDLPGDLVTIGLRASAAESRGADVSAPSQQPRGAPDAARLPGRHRCALSYRCRRLHCRPSAVRARATFAYLSAPGMAVNGVDLESKLADIDGNLIGLNAATAGSGLGIGKLWPKMQGYAELPDYQIPDKFMQGFDPTDMSYSTCEDLLRIPKARCGTDWTPLLAAAQGLGNNVQVLYLGTLEAAHVTVEGQVWADEVAAPRVNGVDVARLQQSAAPPRGGRDPVIRSLARGVAAAQRRARRAAGAAAADVRARHMLLRLRARFGRGIPASARALTRLKRMRAQMTTSAAPDASRAQPPARDLSREIKRLRNSASGCQMFAAVNCTTLSPSGAASVGSLAVASNSRAEMGYSVGAPGTAAGTTLRLYSAGASPDVGDFSIGLAAGTMWCSVGVNGTHRWYCDGITTMNLTSAGELGVMGAFSAYQGLSNIQTYAITDTLTGTTSGANTFHQLSVPAFPVFCNKVTVGTLVKKQAASFDCKLPRQSDVGCSASFFVTGIFDTTNGTGVNYYAGSEVDCSSSDDSYEIFVRSVLPAPPAPPAKAPRLPRVVNARIARASRSLGNLRVSYLSVEELDDLQPDDIMLIATALPGASFTAGAFTIPVTALNSGMTNPPVNSMDSFERLVHSLLTVVYQKGLAGTLSQVNCGAEVCSASLSAGTWETSTSVFSDRLLQNFLVTFDAGATLMPILVDRDTVTSA